MLKYHIINLASCRLCPRRAAGGKERRYMDQNDKNKSNKNNDRRSGVLSLLIWALVLTIGSKTMTVNGTATQLATAPEVKDSRTCLPISPITRAFGASIAWDASARTVTITLPQE